MKKEPKEKVVIIPRPPVETAEEDSAAPKVIMKSMPAPPPAPPAEAPEPVTCPEPSALPDPKPLKELKKKCVRKAGASGKPLPKK